MSIRRPYKWLGAQRYGYENNRANQLLTFKAFASPSGVANLDSDLTINGSTVTASYVYYGGDASASGWSPRVGGEDLSLVSVATPPTYNDGSPLLGADDDSAKFNGSDYFKDTSNTACQINTEDFAIEAIVKNSSSGTEWVISTMTGTPGYAVLTTSSSIVIYIRNTILKTISTTIANNTWYHVLCFVNRDESSTNGSQLYINGVASGSGVDVSSESGSLIGADFSIGARGTSTNNTNANLAYCAMWKKSDWMQAGAAGPTEWATIAATRFAQLTGTYPQVAAGTALPTTATRTYPAYLDKVESDGTSKLYQVGAEWMRQCSRKDANGVELKGYLPEPAATNNFTYSEQFDHANWPPTALSITADSVDSPNGEQTADSMISDGTTGLHYIQQNVTHAASNNVISVFAKKGDRDWFYIGVSTIAANCYFDLNNCAVGTANNGTGYIEDWGNGWCRCILSYTGDGASRAVFFIPADADTDNSITGDGSTVNTYIWGAQHETTGLGYATSYIPTTTAAATRLKDELEYVAGANIGGEDVGQGTIACDVLFPHDLTLTGNQFFASLSDGGSISDNINLYSNGNVTRASSNVSVGTDGATVIVQDPSDGEIHRVRTTYKTNDLRVYDGSEYGTPETTTDIPDDLDRIHIGMYPNTASQGACLISNIRIYKEPTEGGS